MKDEISQIIVKAGNKLQSFTINPKGNDENYLLGSVLDDINDVDLKASDLKESDYKGFRLSLLMLHLSVLQEFDKYYIPNYKPNKSYVLNPIPPSGSIEGPVLGPVDPSEIKDQKTRATYEKKLDENHELGAEIAFQGELSALKLKLSMFNDKVGVISDTLNFIERYYTDSSLDRDEIERAINGVFDRADRGNQILVSLYGAIK